MEGSSAPFLTPVGGAESAPSQGFFSWDNKLFWIPTIIVGTLATERAIGYVSDKAIGWWVKRQEAKKP